MQSNHLCCEFQERRSQTGKENGKNLAGRRNSMCRDSEARKRLEFLRTSRKALCGCSPVNKGEMILGQWEDAVVKTLVLA